MRRSFLVLAVLFVPTVALADDAGAPVSPWIVIGGDVSPITIPQAGEVSLGTIASWKCRAILVTDGHRDTMTIVCTKGDIMARSISSHREGTPSGDPVAFQISAADGSKPARTITFGPQ